MIPLVHIDDNLAVVAGKWCAFMTPFEGKQLQLTQPVATSPPSGFSPYIINHVRSPHPLGSEASLKWMFGLTAAGKKGEIGRSKKTLKLTLGGAAIAL